VHDTIIQFGWQCLKFDAKTNSIKCCDTVVTQSVRDICDIYWNIMVDMKMIHIAGNFRPHQLLLCLASLNKVETGTWTSAECA